MWVYMVHDHEFASIYKQVCGEDTTCVITCVYLHAETYFGLSADNNRQITT